MEVEVGSIYRHFKGHRYKVLLIAYDCDSNGDDLQKMVVYQNIVDNKIWVRKYEDFISKVDKNKYPNSKYVYRFTKEDI